MKMKERSNLNPKMETAYSFEKLAPMYITRALSIQKRSKFVKNEHARYTLGMKKGKNLERLITATSQARF